MYSGSGLGLGLGFGLVSFFNFAGEAVKSFRFNFLRMDSFTFLSGIASPSSSIALLSGVISSCASIPWRVGVAGILSMIYDGCVHHRNRHHQGGGGGGGKKKYRILSVESGAVGEVLLERTSIALRLTGHCVEGSESIGACVYGYVA